MREVRRGGHESSRAWITSCASKISIERPENRRIVLSPQQRPRAPTHLLADFKSVFVEPGVETLHTAFYTEMWK